MFSWAHKRQLIYGLAVLIFLALVIGTPVYLTFFNAAPTCSDGKQNQGETGVDCGGPCARACMQDVIADPIVLWSRPFTVTKGLTNLVAYVQNPNVNYTAEPVEYLFRVYDKENVLLGTRIGRTAIPSTKIFPVFEQAFDAGEKTPVKAFFEFTEPLLWVKSASQKPELEVIDQNLQLASSSPTLSATLVNKTVDTYRRVEVVAIVYDVDGNAMAASKTVVDIIHGNEQAPLIFTWPNPFPGETSKIEILPKIPQQQ